MVAFTRLYEEYSSGTFLVLSVAVAREEVRLPEHKKACVRFDNAKTNGVEAFCAFSRFWPRLEPRCAHRIEL